MDEIKAPDAVPPNRAEISTIGKIGVVFTLIFSVLYLGATTTFFIVKVPKSTSFGPPKETPASKPIPGLEGISLVFFTGGVLGLGGLILLVWLRWPSHSGFEHTRDVATVVVVLVSLVVTLFSTEKVWGLVLAWSHILLGMVHLIDETQWKSLLTLRRARAF